MVRRCLLVILGLAVFCGTGCSGEAKDGSESEPAPLSSADAARDKLRRHLDAEASSSARQLRSVLEPEISVPSNDPTAAHGAAARDAREFGMIGLLNSGGDPDAPTAPWGRDDSVDPLAGDPKEVFPQGLGHGSGGGKWPQVKMGATTVAGRLPPEVIQRIVRQRFGRFRLCYEAGLRKNPNLSGTVSVAFTIKRDGTMGGVSGAGNLPDQAVVGCVSKGFDGLTFPQPEGGVVKVTYPLLFSPGDFVPLPPRTLGGKALDLVTWEDLKSALEREGCTDLEKLGEDGGRVWMKAQKAGRVVDVAAHLVAGATPSSAVITEIRNIEARAAVFSEGGFKLAIAIEGDTDKSASKRLLDALLPK